MVEVRTGNARDRVLKLVRDSKAMRRLVNNIHERRCAYVKGLHGALKAAFLSVLFEERGGQVVYFSSEKEETEEIKEDLEQLLGPAQVRHFPASVLAHSATDHLNHEIQKARLSALEGLSVGDQCVVVADASALLQRLPEPESFIAEALFLSVGSVVDFGKLIASLVEMDFVRGPRVQCAGEIAVRGGLIDIFPQSAEEPVRVEFWGDRIESIRVFDPSSQRSVRAVSDLRVYPQHSEPLSSQPETQHSGLLDYLSDTALVVVDEPDRVRRVLTQTEDGPPSQEEADKRDSKPGETLWKQAEAALEKHALVWFVSIGSQYENLVEIKSLAPESFDGKVSKFKQLIDSKGQDTAHAIFYTCNNTAQAERVTSVFSDEGVNLSRVDVVALPLHRGFCWPEQSLSVYTDHEFYGRTKRLRLPRRRFKGITHRELKHLSRGDYVAHIDFGVGVFHGLKKITVQGCERECLEIRYRDGDAVYVRIERMDRVNKFSPKEGVEPRLNKLGSPEWQRLKERTKKKIKDIAKDLIEIYAARKAQDGFAFSKDVLWERELEVSFPYEDTPDQVTATEDVKSDMESSRPMDRLICGDVGFGKTEIAVRAAFKSVLSGKQVAILVPTTILAYQHQNTFRERLANFPVTVEMLSRFKTKGEQREIVAGLKTGAVDIVIGTHRLLSKDVEFADLGLLVIDEEHRFGVTHKEKLKRYRTTVDVLTLTATPIPRTLQFSLMGVRDMTYITTPPKNRLPIITEILSFNEKYIRTAILKEIDRGGQVFFVHNRVRSIDRVARNLSELVPEANIAVAHGQLPEKELEQIMLDFIQGNYQILVSTMIIESGLDMPNVNTIVVNRADKLGLAQLYQLRGRVGRSHQRAYAYFIIPPVEMLTDEAHKRLRAIEEFSEIGSGTQLALRDLEIRGAGNMLGAEQTGFIDTLGFELYNKILDEAVRELKQDRLPEAEQPQEVETRLEIPFNAFLPEDYVESGAERVDIYRRLTDTASSADLREIWDELQDRFGRLPQPVQDLLHCVAIRNIGARLGLKLVSIEKDEMTAEFSPPFLEAQGEQMQNWLGSIVAKATQPFEFFQNEGLGIRLNLPPEPEEQLKVTRQFFESLEMDSTLN